MNAHEIMSRVASWLGETADVNRDSTLLSKFHVTIEAARKALLQMHFWSFAFDMTRPSLSPEKPNLFFSHQFNLPPDFLAVVYGNYSGRANIDEGGYQLYKGRFILTQNPTFNLAYTRDVTDYSEMDPLFIEALVLRVAIEMCLPVTQDKENRDKLLEVYKSFEFESITIEHRNFPSDDQTLTQEELTDARRVPGSPSADAQRPTFYRPVGGGGQTLEIPFSEL